jgi:hypothetical protein
MTADCVNYRPVILTVHWDEGERDGACVYLEIVSARFANMLWSHCSSPPTLPSLKIVNIT